MYSGCPAALAFVLDGLILGISDYVAMRRAMILAIAAYAPGAALVLRFHVLGLPGRAGLRAGRPHPRHFRLRGHAPRDDPRHRGLRPRGGARAPLPCTRAARPRWPSCWTASSSAFPTTWPCAAR